MAEIKRYRLDVGYDAGVKVVGILEDDDGEYCHFTDHEAALKAATERAEKAEAACQRRVRRHDNRWVTWLLWWQRMRHSRLLEEARRTDSVK